MLTHEQAARVLAVPVDAERSVVRAAMLTRLHELLAKQRMPTDALSVREIEAAYSSLVGSALTVDISDRPTARPADSPDPLPYPPPRNTPSSRSSRTPWRFWMVLLGLATVSVLVWVGLVVSQSPNSGSAPLWPDGLGGVGDSRSPILLDLDPGKSGEVGRCWRGSTSEPAELRRVRCDSNFAELQVVSESTNPEECGDLTVLSEGGWYLCAASI